MGESLANSNFLIIVHQARIDSPIFPLIISPQVSLTYNNTTVRTKVIREAMPIYSENFNFELIKGTLLVVLLNNPAFYKESIIGACSVAIENVSGWFSVFSGSKKVGAIRLTISLDNFNKTYEKEYLLKLNEIQLSQEELSRIKEKYMKKLEKFKHGSQSLTKHSDKSDSVTGEDKENIEKQQKEILKKKALIKLQAGNIEQEKSRIKEAWKEIEAERKEVEEMVKKVKQGFAECQITRRRINLHNRISEYSKTKSSG